MFNIYSSNALGNPSNCTYPIICTITDISSLTEAVSHDYVCAEYKGGYRSSGNFIQSNCIPFDCDNDHSDNPADWITPDDVSRAFPCVTFAVHYSRNHMKQKGGKAARPKFHVLFPVPAIYSSKEYSELKRKIHDAFPYFDNNALDSARFFFGTDSPEVELYMGNITILDFINDSDTITNTVTDSDADFDAHMPTGTYGDMPIREGGRNNHMSVFAARVLKKYGDCDESRKAFMDEANKCTPQLDEAELRTIWNSALKFYNGIKKRDGYVLPKDWNRSSVGMPEPVHLSDILDPPPKPPELIAGILRKGHKMLIAGPSKAGKSFLLIELAIAIAEGGRWLGFKCVQGKVLYINLEIDPASCIDRFITIYNRLGIENRRTDNIIIWNLRGHALPLNELVPMIIEKMKSQTIAAVIVDPIYKVITGDENNASDMGSFCNQFDKICTAMGASAIYCHHHSKGYQGGKKAIDRASGSGVFARDPDAQLDIIGLKKPQSDDEDEDEFDSMRTPWRMEASLREFPPIRNVNFFFDHPIHTLDTQGILTHYKSEGKTGGNLESSSKRTSPEERRKRLDNAFLLAPKTEPVTIRVLAEIADVSIETMRRYLKEFEDEYMVMSGVVQKRPLLSDV